MIDILKKTGSDIYILCKNFIHWNISKIIINISSFILGFLLSLPFLLLGLGFYYLNNDTINKLTYSMYVYGGSENFDRVLLDNIYKFIVENVLVLSTFMIIILVAVFIFLIGFSYKYALMNNLYLNYLKGIKVGFFKNIYASFGKIKKFISISIITSTIFIVYLVLIFGLIFGLYQFGNSVDLKILSIILWSVFAIITLIFCYFSYRTYFSFLLFLEDENNNLSSLEIVKKSIKISSGISVLKFFVIAILFFLYVMLFGIIQKIIINYENIYSIIEFLFLDGVFCMILTSFYNNVLTKKSQEDNAENITKTQTENV